MAKKILIIEDEENLVELLRFRLEANGYEVEAAYNGEEGLGKIKKIKPDIVVLDVMMPKMHGYEVCMRAKKNEATRNIPIIVLTAHTQTGDIDEAKKGGADYFISKPFEPTQLLEEIKRLLK